MLRLILFRYSSAHRTQTYLFRNIHTRTLMHAHARSCTHARSCMHALINSNFLITSIINNVYAIFQVLTNVLLTRSAGSGQMFTRPPKICVNKSGLTPTFIPATPSHQVDACSSGSMCPTQTRRSLSTILTAHSNTKVLP